MTEEIMYSQDPADFYYVDINVPCQGACPAYTNIPAYIRAVFEGDHSRSYDINRMANILPGVLGRICSLSDPSSIRWSRDAVRSKGSRKLT